MTTSTKPLFLVTERFGPQRGDEWDKYLAWSRLAHLTEVVTLDSGLCPLVIDEVRDDDWPHVVNEDFMLHCFTDLDHLLRRCGGVADRNLLCVFLEPAEHPTPPGNAPPFAFEGHDLVDVHGGISALTNCGGFPLAFCGDELSEHGLIPSLARARQVQAALRRHYPREPHADCHVWSVFRAGR